MTYRNFLSWASIMHKHGTADNAPRRQSRVEHSQTQMNLELTIFSNQNTLSPKAACHPRVHKGSWWLIHLIELTCEDSSEENGYPFMKLGQQEKQSNRCRILELCHMDGGNSRKHDSDANWLLCIIICQCGRNNEMSHFVSALTGLIFRKVSFKGIITHHAIGNSILPTCEADNYLISGRLDWK